MESPIKCLITMSNLAEQFENRPKEWSFDPEIIHTFSHGLYSRQMILPAGNMAFSHSHTYSHLSILAKGRVIVKTDDYNKEYTAPTCIEIEANTYHQIEALEDAVWFCIHATDETDVNKIDEVLIGKNEN